MRLAALGALLLAVYAATLTIPATAQDRYAGDERQHLQAAQVWIDEGEIDQAELGVGLPLLISPALALGGSRLVELLIAVLTAIAFVLAAALARRLVPEPWASGAALAVGLSAPVLAAATTVAPEPVAGALLAGAALCALKVRERARLRYAYGAALMLGLLPWLDAPLALVGLPVAYCLVRWLLDQRRRLVALIAGELLLGSLLFYVRLNETLFGGPLPASAGGPDLAGYLERAPNLVLLWLDPSAGLLRWAPVLALAFAGAWLLWRSRRAHVAAAIPARREAERAGALLVVTAGAQWVVAAFAVSEPEGPWFPGLPMAAALPALAALAAWGLRRTRFAGAALAGVTLVVSAWVLGDAWLGPPEGWIGVAR